MIAGASLERRIVLVTLGVLALSFSSLAVWLYTAFARALEDGFDVRLREAAADLSAMVEESPDGTFDVEGSLDDFGRSHGFSYFEVRAPDGSVIVASKSIVGVRAYDAAMPSIEPIAFPDGRSGRRYRAALFPRPPDEEPSACPTRRVTVTVEGDTTAMDATLRRVRTVFFASAALALGLSAAVMSLAVRRGLAPAARLGDAIEQIDARGLSARVSLHDLPRELVAPVAKLNQLLERLEASFERERQFSADASHELRTPLAGLRSILEVAASRDRAASEYRAAISDALEVVTDMSRLVENLLLLARADTGAAPHGAMERVFVRELVDECFEPLADAARARRLRFENRVPANVVVESDRARLRVVLANLLDNAVEYTSAGGGVSVESDPSCGIIFDVKDTGPPLPDEVLDRLFDRFFRLDPSRGGGRHAGIGLSIVKSTCAALGFAVSARNDPGGGIAFRVAPASGGN